jgi:hypothetical protein
MMQFERKLQRPPYVHNWIRNMGCDLESTTKKLVALALGFPTKSYAAATPIIFDCIVSDLDRNTAIKAAQSTGRPNSRDIVTEYVSSFYDWNEVRQYNGKPTFDEMIEPFRIGKGISVPVKPLVNIVENGKLVPIFSVGWASMPFNLFQMRLLATVLEDAVFSLTDFKMSPGEFVFLPKNGKEENAVRKPLVWRRGEMNLLSTSELRDCLHMYLEALDAAKAIVRDMPKKEKNKPKHPNETRNQLQLDF